MSGGSQDTELMRQAGEVIAEKFDIAQGIKKQIEDSAQQAWAGWKGGASLSFQRAIENFCGKIQDQLEILNGLRETMGQNELSYRVTADDTEAAVNAVAAQLDA